MFLIQILKQENSLIEILFPKFLQIIPYKIYKHLLDYLFIFILLKKIILKLAFLKKSFQTIFSSFLFILKFSISIPKYKPFQRINIKYILFDY